MHGLLRIAVLLLFATAGVGLAASVAIQLVPPHMVTASDVATTVTGDFEISLPPHSEEPIGADEQAVEVTPPLTLPASVVDAPQPATILPAPEPPAPPSFAGAYAPAIAASAEKAPIPASYEPLVAAQFDFLRHAIDRMQNQQEQTSEIIAQMRQDLPPPIDQQRPPGPFADTVPLVDKVNEPQLAVSEEDRITLTLDSSDLREVLRVLGEAGGLSILPSESVQGTLSATLTDLDIPTALDVIIKSKGYVSRREGAVIFVGTYEELHGLQHVGEIVGTRTYRLNYVSARDMQALITPMLSELGSVTVSAASEVGIASDSANAGGDAFAGNPIVMVRDFLGILEQIDHLVAEVDCIPPQVAIESTILSVKLDDKTELGVNFELLRDQETIRIVSGVALNSLDSLSLGEGLKVGFLDTSLFLLVRALETIGDTNVIASPRVLCLNKQRSEIHIGSELGYVNTTVTETAATQAVQFLEVGTHLLIRPFISNDGLIRMEVHPELSTGRVRVEGGFTLPDKDVTQVTTNVLCPDGATVVIGGLIRENLSVTATQIPVLGNLPILGPAFRQRQEEIDRHEIIVLLTPRLVNEADLWVEGQQYGKHFRDRRDVFADKMTPIGKRYYGEHYVRLANAAWAAGDADVALRHVNLGIHFDPLNQGGIKLREQILAAYPDLEVGIHQHLHRGVYPWNRALKDYSKQGWPWQTEPGPGPVTGYVGDLNVEESVEFVPAGPESREP